MVDPTHHHRRIRFKAHAIHWGLLPLAFLIPGAWVYCAMDLCQDTIDPLALSLCRYAQAVPLLPIVFGLALAAWILKDLAHLGAHHLNAKPRLLHVAHGYRALETPHRRHVHLAFFEVAAVALGLIAWLAYHIYSTTY